MPTPPPRRENDTRRQPPRPKTVEEAAAIAQYTNPFHSGVTAADYRPSPKSATRLSLYEMDPD